MKLTEIVFDSVDPPRLARFWADALDDFEVRDYDQPEIERLAELGLSPDSDPCVMVDGPGLVLCFQLADGSSAAKRRLHLDLETDDRARQVAHAVERGATLVETFESHTWLRDPEGNDFCITDARQPQ